MSTQREVKFVLSVALVLCLGGEAAGVGPFFENERSPGDQLPGPNPEILVPGPKLRPIRPGPEAESPEVTRLVKGTLLAIDRDMYVVRDDSGETEIALKLTPDTRMSPVPRVGDKIEAEVQSNGDIWSLKPTQ